MRRVKIDRRLHPRLSQTLPLKVAANGYDFNTTTQNISCVGTYCTVSKYIPPFTKLAIKLTLPILNGSQGPKELHIECKGVVVRTDDEANGGFNIAVFFNGINDTQRHKITQYINQLLPQGAVA